MLDGLVDIQSGNLGEFWSYNLIYASFKRNHIKLLQIWSQIINLGIVNEDLIVFGME